MTTHKYPLRVRCVVNGRTAKITNHVKSDFLVPKYRVDFTDNWKITVPFAIVCEDDIIIKEGDKTT